MKNKVLFFIVILAVLVTAMPLFAQEGLFDTIEEAYPDRMEKTKIGMSIDEFKEIWPEATRTGIDGNTETYLFVYTRRQGRGLNTRRAYLYKINMKFIFKNNKLESYSSERSMV